MLLDKLKEISQPKKLDKVFSDNKESVLFDRLTASLREVATGIKEQMKSELKQISLEFVSEAMGKIKIPRDGIDGIDGKAISGKDGLNGKNGKDAIINETKIIAEVLKQIPINKLGKKGGGGSTLRINNLSSQCDGVTKSFTTTNRIGENHIVIYSSFPTLFLPTTDYTISTNVITLGASVDAPAAGQSLAAVYESSD